MPSPSNSLRAARPYLGTLVEISIDADLDVAQVQTAVNAAFSAVARVHQLMSFHDPDSDVSRINRTPAGIPIQIDPATYEVLGCAQRLSQRSQGAFDLTIAKVLVAQGFLPDVDSLPEIALASYRDLALLDAHQVLWQRSGRIDLGGIAKGYAVDCAIDVLQQHGIPHALVNAGGDLRCIGRPQPIHIRHPDDPQQLVAVGWLCDGALATSAGYYAQQPDLQSAAQQMINPIVDPQQQRCLAWQSSISVVAARCMMADALTKVVRLWLDDAAPDRLAQLLADLDAQALLLDQRGLASLGSSDRLRV